MDGSHNTPDEGDQYARLMAVFRRKGSDGQYYFSDDDIRHWLPLALLASDVDPANWTRAELSVFAKAMQKAGIDPSTDAHARALAAFYQRHPLNAELAAELAAVVSLESMEASEAVQRRLRIAQRAVASSGPSLGAPKSPDAGGIGLRRKK